MATMKSEDCVKAIISDALHRDDIWGLIYSNEPQKWLDKKQCKDTWATVIQHNLKGADIDGGWKRLWKRKVGDEIQRGFNIEYFLTMFTVLHYERDGKTSKIEYCDKNIIGDGKELGGKLLFSSGPLGPNEYGGPIVKLADGGYHCVVSDQEFIPLPSTPNAVVQPVKPLDVDFTSKHLEVRDITKTAAIVEVSDYIKAHPGIDAMDVAIELKIEPSLVIEICNELIECKKVESNPTSNQDIDAMCKDSGITPKVMADFTKKHFGAEPTKFEYKIVAAAIRLFSNLPGSHMRSSIVKTMRGLAKAPVCLKQPDAGIIEGMRQYKEQQINHMVDDVFELLKHGDVSEEADLPMPDWNDPTDNRDYAPEWIQTKEVNRIWGRKIADTFEAYGAAFGRDEVLPDRVKVNKVKPSALLKKVPQATLEKIVDAAVETTKKFLADNPGWTQGFGYYGWKYHSKSVKNGILTVKFGVPDNFGSKDRITSASNIELVRNTHKDWWNDVKEFAVMVVIDWTEDGQKLLKWSIEWLPTRGY